MTEAATAPQPETTLSSDVRVEERGALGIITLCRPETKNMLTLASIRTIDLALEDWAAKDSIKLVIIRHEGEDFCVGADVEKLYETLEDLDHVMQRDYFREEYILNRHIFHFPKPILSIINGSLEGDGIGIGIFGNYQIVTDKARIHLSETDIGFVIDGGATYILSRFPGKTGFYTGLVGHELDAADAIYTGIATHYVPSSKLAEVEKAILGIGGENAEEALQSILKPFTNMPGQSKLQSLRDKIDFCFSHSMLEVVCYLLAEGDQPWHKETLAALEKHSPTCLKISHRLIRAGRRLDFDAALELEYRVVQHVMRHPDFAEGIRAYVIDKDEAPNWQPSILEAVSTKLVDHFFMPLPEGELRLKIADED